MITSGMRDAEDLRDAVFAIVDVTPPLRLRVFELALDIEGHSELRWEAEDGQDAANIEPRVVAGLWDTCRFYLNLPELHAVRAVVTMRPGEVVRVNLEVLPRKSELST